jgi:hypothetical protein
MSERRPPPLSLSPPLVDEDEDEDEEEDEDDADDVEYFVDVEAASVVSTSVPKDAHWSQTSSSAPSTLTVFGDGVSVPHISH